MVEMHFQEQGEKIMEAKNIERPTSSSQSHFMVM